MQHLGEYTSQESYASDRAKTTDAIFSRSSRQMLCCFMQLRILCAICCRTSTISLDAESERIIQNNLEQIRHDRSTLIIAHRLSTVQNADLILVLEKGILIEQGTHLELMTKRGHYHYLNR